MGWILVERSGYFAHGVGTGIKLWVLVTRGGFWDKGVGTWDLYRILFSFKLPVMLGTWGGYLGHGVGIGVTGVVGSRLSCR